MEKNGFAFPLAAAIAGNGRRRGERFRRTARRRSDSPKPHEGGKMLHALIADAQARLDEARRQLRLAAINFDIPDDELLELRARARNVYEELAGLDRKKLKGSLFSALKFW
jgi:hypothetical protein